MQANVFGAADVALQVEGGTQNPQLCAAGLLEPSANPGTAGAQVAASAEAGRKSPCTSAAVTRPAVTRPTVFVFSIMVSRIRNALRRSFCLQY